MKIIIRLAHPQTDKQRLFQLEVPIDDLKNPGRGNMVIEGKEYLLEVYYD